MCRVFPSIATESQRHRENSPQRHGDTETIRHQPQRHGDTEHIRHQPRSHRDTENGRHRVTETLRNDYSVSFGSSVVASFVCAHLRSSTVNSSARSTNLFPS